MGEKAEMVVEVGVQVHVVVEVGVMVSQGRGPGRGVCRGTAFWTEIPKTLPMLMMHISIFYMYHGTYALVRPIHIG